MTRISFPWFTTDYRETLQLSAINVHFCRFIYCRTKTLCSLIKEFLLHLFRFGWIEKCLCNLSNHQPRIFHSYSDSFGIAN